MRARGGGGKRPLGTAPGAEVIGKASHGDHGISLGISAFPKRNWRGLKYLYQWDIRRTLYSLFDSFTLSRALPASLTDGVGFRPIERRQHDQVLAPKN